MEEGIRPILELSGLTINFGGNIAVNEVTIKVQAYQFVSLIGPNGAGKTTLFNLISGQYQSTSGAIFLKGKEITEFGVAETAQFGIGRSFQLASYYPNLTVLENVCLAIQILKKKSWVFWKRTSDFPEFEDQAYEILKSVLLADKWNHSAATLSHGEQRKLEIAILLGMDPEIMLLDEPTAGMSIEEVPAILDLLEALRDKRDRTILLVEHKIDMVIRLSDKIAVLQEGRLIAYDDPQKIMENKQVQAAYLGKAYEG
ncbi:ABC transporter ATP-binding protein [bacterium]|nr:ABC transporter ATP-binding protein [bacterium]